MPALVVLLFDKEGASYDSEKGTTLNECSSQNHVSLYLSRSLGLTCNSVHSATTNLTNTQTSTDCCDTCSKSTAQLSHASYQK